jgi:hypothetical protein
VIYKPATIHAFLNKIGLWKYQSSK